MMKKVTAITLTLMLLIGNTALAAQYERVGWWFFKDTPWEEAAVQTISNEHGTLEAKDSNLYAIKNTPITASLSATTTGDPALLVYDLESQPKNGSLELKDVNTGLYTYTPNTDYVGTDSFLFRVVDEKIGTSSATVYITVSENAESSPEASESPAPTEPPEETPAPTATPKPTLPADSFRYSDMLGHWGEYSAVKITEKGILKGFQIGNDYLFYPENQMNRGEFIMYLVSTMEIDLKPYESMQSPFADSASLPYYLNLYGKAAYDAEIIKGVAGADGQLYLHPYEVLTRMEAIQMLNNIIKPEVAAAEEPPFADWYLVPDWGKEAVQNMVGYGIIQGYDDNTIRPFEKLNRAMATEALWQTVKYRDENPSFLSKLTKMMEWLR